MSAKTIHIFRSGEHRSRKGDIVSFDDNNIRATAEAYNQWDGPLAPLLLGHTQGPGETQCGQIRGLVAKDSDLYAVADVNPAWVDAVRAGRILSVSASMHMPYSPDNPRPGVFMLRHVAFLGAEPPAVKGLQRMDFAECVLEFSEDGAIEAAGLPGILNALRAVPGLAYGEVVGYASHFERRQAGPQRGGWR